MMGTAFGQNITGTWQGVLKAETDLRVILLVTKDDGKLKATMYSIDQGATPMKASSVVVDGTTFKYAVDALGGSFSGKLGEGGNTISGTWTQWSMPLPLVLLRANKETAWEIPPPPAPPKVMAADADPSFEVATIKPDSTGANQMQQLAMSGRNFRTRATSLEDLISFAYEVQAKQIVNGPEWLGHDRYDIEAIPDIAGVPNLDQMRAMVRKLLADRFQLKYRKSTRELSAFVLTVGKGGETLTPTQFKGPGPSEGILPAAGGLSLMMRNGTITDFAGLLQTLVLDRPVVDRTKLKGRYDLSVTFLPDETQFHGHSPVPKPPDGVESAPGLAEALQAQIGLKVSAEKTTVEVIAIDRATKPTAN